MFAWTICFLFLVIFLSNWNKINALFSVYGAVFFLARIDLILILFSFFYGKMYFQSENYFFFCCTSRLFHTVIHRESTVLNRIFVFVCFYVGKRTEKRTVLFDFIAAGEVSKYLQLVSRFRIHFKNVTYIAGVLYQFSVYCVVESR